MTASAMKPSYNTTNWTAPAQAPGSLHPSPGAISGRLTTSNTSAGLPHAYLAVVDASNTAIAYYVGESDANGFYQFPTVNNTWNFIQGDGGANATASNTGQYGAVYKIYANHSLFGEGYSISFPVEERSTTPANVCILPKAVRIIVSADRSTFTANGSDNITMSVLALDALGDPVADGTCIDFIVNDGRTYDAGNMGRWGAGPTQRIHAYTTGGFATATYGWVPSSSAASTITLSAVQADQNTNNVYGNISILIRPTCPNVDWEKIYSSSAYESGTSIEKTSDGFILAGYSFVDDVDGDIYLVKTDINGNKLWNKTYARAGEDYGHSVIAVNDGYIIAGSSTLNANGSSDVYLLKTNLAGDYLWGKTYGGPKNDSGTSVMAVSDGFVICGNTYSFGNGDYDIYLIKTDFEGNLLWNKTCGGSGYDAGLSLISVSDGYVITGVTNSSGNRHDDVCLIKTDLNGNVQWSKTYGGTGWESGNSVVALDNGYLVAGQKGDSAFWSDDSYDVYLVKTDLNGNEIWSKTYGGFKSDIGRKVVVVDNGYTVAGSTSSYCSGFSDVYLLKTDKNGGIIWQTTCGGENRERGTSAVVAGNSYIVVGSVVGDLYLAKLTDPDIATTSTPTTLPLPVPVKAPPMWGYNHVPPVWQQPGAVSGRVTTMNTSFGLPNAYIAIVNASNTSQAFYQTTSDANGFYQFPNVNHTYNGSQYLYRYKIYANHSLFGTGLSNSFPVEKDSTAPANIVLINQSTTVPPQVPTTLHIGNKDFHLVPAPAMGASGHAGAVSGRVTTHNTSFGIADADVLIVNASDITQAYYVGKSDSNGFYQFTGVNSTSLGEIGRSPYKIYVYSSLLGEGFSNSFPVEAYSTASVNAVIIPIPAHISVSTSKKTLVADCSDHLTISVYLTDALGDPVADNTQVRFITYNNSTNVPVYVGSWNQTTGPRIKHVGPSMPEVTHNGYAEAEYGWILADSGDSEIRLTVADYYNLSLNNSTTIAIRHDSASVEWFRTVDGLRKMGESIVPLSDGYIIAGTVSSPVTGEDIYLTRTDLNGNPVWEKSYDLNLYDQGRSVLALRDGFIVAGSTVDNSGLADVCIIKTNLSGDIVWQKTYGGLSSDTAQSIIATDDGYVITGLTFSSGHGNSDVYLLKIDPSGNVLWEQTYGGTDWDCGNSVAATDDGYIIAGDTCSDGGPFDVYLVKTDKMGNLVWDKTYGGDDNEEGRSILVAHDGFVITGYTVSFADHSYSSGSCDLYLLKTDLAGNQLWQKTYGGTRGDLGYSIAATIDGYVIAGSSDTDSGSPDVYLVKTDFDGGLIWQKTCGGDFIDNGKSVVVVRGGYVVVGEHIPSSDSNSELYLVKFTEDYTPDASKTVTYNMSLYQGWNLVSIPLDMQDSNLSAIFPEAVTSNITSIWGWSESAQNWVYYSPSDPYFYDYYPALTELETGKAYWVELTQPAVVTISGKVPASAPDSRTALGSGWNFVGSTGMSSPLISSMYPDVVSVWGWDASEQNWVYYSPVDDYFYAYYPELNNAKPGCGYWVEMI